MQTVFAHRSLHEKIKEFYGFFSELIEGRTRQIKRADVHPTQARPTPKIRVPNLRPCPPRPGYLLSCP
jgi:hypothetical protein